MEIQSEMLRRLLDYWRSRCPAGGLPRRADIDPVAIKPLLPHVLMIDVEDAAAAAFRVRLAGTYVEAAFAQPLTGLDLTAIKLDDEADAVIGRYRAAVATAAPVVSWHAFLNEDGRRFRYEQLLLPLAADGAPAVGRILAGICFVAPLPTPRVPFR